MAVGSVLIALQASRGDGRGITSAEFLNLLKIEPGEVEATRADGGAWSSGMIYFAVVNRRDFNHVDSSIDAGAPTEAFFVGVGDAFQKTARFLNQRTPDVTAAMKRDGLSLRLFVAFRMDQDQMEMELPSELLAACGRHNLSIYLISNDIPAAELLE